MAGEGDCDAHPLFSPLPNFVISCFEQMNLSMFVPQRGLDLTRSLLCAKKPNI